MFFTGAVPRAGLNPHGGDIALCNHSNNGAGSVNRDAAADTCGVGVCIGEQVLDIALELREDGAGIELLHEGHEQTADDNDNDGDDDDIEERTFTALIGQTVGNLCEKLLHRDTFLRGLPAIKIDEMCMYGTSPEDVTPLPTAPRVEGCHNVR